jgi:hypothetical protein
MPELRSLPADLAGYDAARKHPEAAIDTLMDVYPQLKRKTELRVLETTFPYYCAPGQQGKPYGENKAADFSRAAKALGVAGSNAPDRFMTNRFFIGDGATDIATC